MENDKIKALLERYQLGTLTPEEKAKLETWYIRYASEHQRKANPEIMQEHVDQIASNLPFLHTNNNIKKLRPYLSGAALLIIGFGLFLLTKNRDDSKIATTAIQPGYNQATLTLANGRTVNLDSAQREIIIADEDIIYSDGRKVADAQHVETYHAKDSLQVGLNPPYAMLTTPIGGQYRIVLADGTKVMLNASSTLRYPNRFTGPTRIVEISGEGFFEVARIKDKPFIVKSKNQEIDVLGTSFNVNAYADGPNERTTLVTGSLKVAAVNLKQEQLLTPGSQATIRGNKLTVNTIDVDNEIAWTKGYFTFDKNTLEEVLKQLSRWYSIDHISYSEETLKHELFSGTINRYDQIAQVLRKLSLTGTIAFHTEGRTIQVTRGDPQP